MTTFTIDADNNITALPTPEHAQDALGAQMFTTQKELAKLASGWSGARLIEIWNSFAGVAPFDDLKPVKKFTDRKRATTRIWDAIQRLAPVAKDSAQDPPKAATRTKDATTKKGAPKAKKGAKEATPREGSKKQIVLDLLRRPNGATLAEIAKATDWQRHSIRGFISNLGKRDRLTVESSKEEGGERTYRLCSAPHNR